MTLRRLTWRAMAVQRSQWNLTAPVLSMLEACRQQNIAFDPLKWNPLAARDAKSKKSTPADHKAFRAALNAGKDVRR